VTKPDDTLTAVAGLNVGHATSPEGRTGCTVVLGPFRAAAEVRGLATGTRELGVLAPEHLVPRIDAILLSGGSAFGLAAADGVVAWLAERGRGYETRVAPVPIVPAAVIFDLDASGPRPDAALGRAACEAAGTGPVPRGRVGAGAGATVGKLGGIERAAPGGVGSRARQSGEWTVGALVVVNAVGDVVDATGRVVGGAHGADDRSTPERGGRAADLRLGENTTLAVVATDAPLDRIGLARLARMAGTALARRIVPVHTPYDGDMVFAVSPTPDPGPITSPDLLSLGIAAREALEDAIVDAVATAAGAS
jgi:L-aminopeptidase/D-esterase-like protein